MGSKPIVVNEDIHLSLRKVALEESKYIYAVAEELLEFSLKIRGLPHEDKRKILEIIERNSRQKSM